MKKFLISALISFGTLLSTVGVSFADELLVPHFTYRVGPFAANGTAVANGYTEMFSNFIYNSLNTNLSFYKIR